MNMYIYIYIYIIWRLAPLPPAPSRCEDLRTWGPESRWLQCCTEQDCRLQDILRKEKAWKKLGFWTSEGRPCMHRFIFWPPQDGRYWPPRMVLQRFWGRRGGTWRGGGPSPSSLALRTWLLEYWVLYCYLAVLQHSVLLCIGAKQTPLTACCPLQAGGRRI